METFQRGAWHPIPGCEDSYEVWIGEDERSGTIRSLHREVSWGKGLRELPARTLRPSRAGRYLHVTLYKGGKQITVRPH